MRRNTARLTLRMLVPFLLVGHLQAQELSVAARGEMAVGREVMVATAHPLASEAALEMLRQGGNAVDAAVAAAFAIGVVEPDGSGLGGGGGMLIYLKASQTSVYINYYTQASERADELGYKPSDSKSARAITVPGTAAGLTAALESYGTLPLSVVVAPAIRHAEQGFPLDETLSSIVLDNVELLQKYPSTASLYLRDGFPLMFGDTLRFPELAETLRKIAREGRAGFYEGPVADSIVEAVTRYGGVLTLNDLKNFRPIVSEPARGSYRGYDVLSASAPQSGATVVEGLHMLETVDLKAMGHFSRSSESLHIMAETMRRVYADRIAFIEDPRFRHIPITGLTSKAFARNRFESINRAMADPPEYRKTQPGNPMAYDRVVEETQQEPVQPAGNVPAVWDDKDEDGASSYQRGDDLFDRWGRRKKVKKDDASPVVPKIQKKDSIDTEEDIGMIWRVGEYVSEVADAGEGGGHTTHLTVVDKDGNAVSLTQTLGTFFGSGLTAAGVLLNTSMSNYAQTTAINAVAPNKQPRSSIAPTIILKDGDLFMTVGSPGAGRIIATVIQVIVNAVDFGMNASEANNAPRFFCQKFDDYLHLEGRIGVEVREGLERKKHNLKVYGDYDLYFGGVQLIMFDRETGMLTGSADRRRGGSAIGY